MVVGRRWGVGCGGVAGLLSAALKTGTDAASTRVCRDLHAAHPC